MNFIRKLTLVFSLAISFSCLAKPDCASDEPSSLAKEFYSKHEDFHYVDPLAFKNLITPRFYVALEKEHKCPTGELCALDSVPWTNAQDGEISEPITFNTKVNTGTKASVQMSYVFVLSPQQQKPQSVTLKYERSNISACWLLSDLVTPNGDSILEYLEKWQSKYGNGL